MNYLSIISHCKHNDITLQEKNYLINTIESYFNHLLSIKSLTLDEERMIIFYIHKYINMNNIPTDLIKKFIKQSKFTCINYALVHDRDIDSNLKKILFFKLFEDYDIANINDILLLDLIVFIEDEAFKTDELLKTLELCDNRLYFSNADDIFRVLYSLITSQYIELSELNKYLNKWFMAIDIESLSKISTSENSLHIIKWFIINYKRFNENISFRNKILNYIFSYKGRGLSANNKFILLTEAVQRYMNLTQDELNAYYALKELK